MFVWRFQYVHGCMRNISCVALFNKMMLYVFLLVSPALNVQPRWILMRGRILSCLRGIYNSAGQDMVRTISVVTSY